MVEFTLTTTILTLTLLSVCGCRVKVNLHRTDSHTKMMEREFQARLSKKIPVIALQKAIVYVSTSEQKLQLLTLLSALESGRKGSEGGLISAMALEEEEGRVYSSIQNDLSETQVP